MALFRGPNIVTDGLVFAMDPGSTRSYPGSGTTTTNIINGASGTLNNGVAYVTNNGGAFDFDGTDDYIQFSNYSAHQSTTGTIEAWVKMDNLTGDRYIFGIGGTTTYGASRALRINGGNFSVVTYGSSTQDWNGITAATTDWTHVAMGWNGTTLYFYLNGYYRLSVPRTGVVTPLGTVFRIGMPPWSVSSAIDGQIASVRHYSIALTEDQMRQNYNAQKSRFGL